MRRIPIVTSPGTPIAEHTYLDICKSSVLDHSDSDEYFEKPVYYKKPKSCAKKILVGIEKNPGPDDVVSDTDEPL